MTTPRKQSFPPMVGERPEILILGSLPGEESLRRQEYYAKPQNRFWPLMARLTATPLPQTYAEKRAMLASHRIALWDVVQEAERRGSADTDIKHAVPNDIPALLRAYPTIHTVAFNGKKAADLFRRHFGVKPAEEPDGKSPQEMAADALRLGLPAARPLRFMVRLSTSPANCQFGEEALYRNWAQIFADRP